MDQDHFLPFENVVNAASSVNIAPPGENNFAAADVVWILDFLEITGKQALADSIVDQKSQQLIQFHRSETLTTVPESQTNVEPTSHVGENLALAAEASGGPKPRRYEAPKPGFDL